MFARKLASDRLRRLAGTGAWTWKFLPSGSVQVFYSDANITIVIPAEQLRPGISKRLMKKPKPGRP